MTQKNTTDGNLPFPELLKIHREAAGMTQDALAARMSDLGHPWHKSTVSRTEGGQRDPHLSEVASLAGILGVGIEALSGADPLAQYRALADLEREKSRVLLQKALSKYAEYAESADRHEDLVAGLRREVRALEDLIALHERVATSQRELSTRALEVARDLSRAQSQQEVSS